MNYPKIGDKYTLAQGMSFVDANDCGNESFGTLYLHEGEKILFAKMLEAFSNSKNLIWKESSICVMSVDDEYAFVIPYRNLKELVQSGVLVQAK